MATSDKINFEEILDIGNSIRQVNELADGYTKLNIVLTESLKVSQTVLKTKQKEKVSADNIDAQTDAINENAEKRKKLNTVLTEQQKLEAKLLQLQSDEAKAIAKLKVQIDAQNKANKEEALGAKKILDAYQLKSKKLNDLRKEYKAVAVEQGLGAKATKDLALEVQKLDKELKDIDASAGQFNRNVGNYENAINNAIYGTGEFGSTVQSVKANLAEFKDIFRAIKEDLGNFKENFQQANGAINKGAVAFKGLGTAMKATGILLVITALAGLVTYFKATEEGGDALAEKMAQLKAIGSQLIQSLAKLGSGLVGLFGNLAKSFTAFVAFNKVLVLSLKLGFQEIKGIFKDNSKAIEETNKQLEEQNKLIQDGIDTNYSEEIKKITGAFDGFGDKVRKVTEEESKLFQLQDAFEEKMIGFEQVLAKLALQEEKYATASGDTSDSFKDRKEAENKLIATQIKRIGIQDKIAKTELDFALKQAEIDTGISKNKIKQMLLNEELFASGKAEGQAQGLLTTEKLKSLNELYLKTVDTQGEIDKVKRDSLIRERELLQKQLLITTKIQQEQNEIILNGYKSIADSADNTFGVRGNALNEFQKLNIKSYEEQIKLINDLNGGVIDSTKLLTFETATQIEEYIKTLGIKGEKVNKEVSDILLKYKKNKEESAKSEITLNKDIEKSEQNRLKSLQNIEADNLNMRTSALQMAYDLEKNYYSKTQKLDITKQEYFIKQLKQYSLEQIEANRAVENQLAKSIVNAEEREAKLLEIKTKYDNQKIKQEAQTQKQIDDLQEANRIKRIDVADKYIKDVFTATNEEISKQQNKLNETIGREIEDRNKEVERQRDLASKGLANNLAFEEKKLKEAELNKRLIEDKAQQRREALQLAESYYQAYISRLKEPNSNPLIASGKALTDTLVAKAIGKTIAGAFYEGTDDNKNVAESLGFGGASKRDGYLIKADGRERIFDPTDSEALGQYTNKEVVHMVSNFNDGQQKKTVVINDNSQVVSALNKVYQAIESKPVQQVNVDSLGNIVEKLYQVNRTIKTTHRRRL